MNDYRQVNLIPFVCPEDSEQDKCFRPDFGNVDKLYKEFGVNNDIDLAMQKPQYRDIVNSRLQEIAPSESPRLPDNVMADNMVSREYDANELREIAISQAKEYRKNKKK